jgi:hypothetical protein
MDRLAELVGVPIPPADRPAILEALMRNQAMAEQVAAFVLADSDEPATIFQL